MYDTMIWMCMFNIYEVFLNILIRFTIAPSWSASLRFVSRGALKGSCELLQPWISWTIRLCATEKYSNRKQETCGSMNPNGSQWHFYKKMKDWMFLSESLSIHIPWVCEWIPYSPSRITTWPKVTSWCLSSPALLRRQLHPPDLATQPISKLIKLNGTEDLCQSPHTAACGGSASRWRSL